MPPPQWRNHEPWWLFFDAMMKARASVRHHVTVRALRAAVREWVRNVECQPEAHES